jgi:hypothetical protein
LVLIGAAKKDARDGDAGEEGRRLLRRSEPQVLIRTRIRTGDSPALAAELFVCTVHQAPHVVTPTLIARGYTRFHTMKNRDLSRHRKLNFTAFPTPLNHSSFNGVKYSIEFSI